MAQFAVKEDLLQFGLSGPVKYWLDLPGVATRLKVNLQGGLDFLHFDPHTSVTSWLIPIGVGLDYALTQSPRLTSTFLLNFTGVDTGNGTGTHVMPGLTFGVRF